MPTRIRDILILTVFSCLFCLYCLFAVSAQAAARCAGQGPPSVPAIVGLDIIPQIV